MKLPHCSCPTGATLDEIMMGDGHWPGCPRGEAIDALMAGITGHGPACRRPYSSKCRAFSTDGTLLGADIAHTFGTTDEDAITDLFGLPKPVLDGMDAEQADWEAGDE